MFSSPFASIGLFLALLLSLLAIPLASTSSLLATTTKITADTIPPPPPPPPQFGCSDVFRIVEEMPRFPGCEDIAEEGERKTCSERKFLDYLYSNLRLTPLQSQSCVVGKAVIQFVIEKDGAVTGAKIIRDPGCGYGQSFLEVVGSMNENGIRWTPGRQGGRLVRVQYNVPINIRLE